MDATCLLFLHVYLYQRAFKEVDENNSKKMDDYKGNTLLKTVHILK